MEIPLFGSGYTYYSMAEKKNNRTCMQKRCDFIFDFLQEGRHNILQMTIPAECLLQGLF